MDGEACWATVHGGHKESDTTERLHFRRFLWLSDEQAACSAGDVGDLSSIPGSGRSPGGGNGNPLQYSCLGYPMDRRAWCIIVH